MEWHSLGEHSSPGGVNTISEMDSSLSQFLLDVMRRHYAPGSVVDNNLSEDDGKTIRGSLLGLIRFFLVRDVTAR